MFTWDSFIWFGLTAIALSLASAVTSLCANDHWAASSVKYRQNRSAAVLLSVLSVLVMGTFITGFWIMSG